MKAQLIFDLNDRDDDMAHKRCIKSMDMALVIWEFQHNRKRTLEENIEKLDKYEVLDLVFEEFNRICDEYVVDVDALIE